MDTIPESEAGHRNLGHQALQKRRLKTTMTVYRFCVGLTVLVSAIWSFLMVTRMDAGMFFGGYEIDLYGIVHVFSFLVFSWMCWSYACYLLKWRLLGRSAMSREDLRLVFGSRLQGFELEDILSRYPERVLRIIDMVGRRSRTVLFGLGGFAAVYIGIGMNPTPESLQHGLQIGLLDAMAVSWWSIATFRSNGVVGYIAYGAHSRVLDGIQGRANVLCIITLWNAFRFVMVPLGVQLGRTYPPETYAVVWAFIWIAYVTADSASEIFGSIFGKHGIRVWGLGDMNRKSWAGVVAAFLTALLLNTLIVYGNGLSPSWYGLAIIIAVVDPFVELYSPRGTDDFTMATTNALICWGYGLLLA